MTFKEVAHLYMGCQLSHKWSSAEERTFVTLGTDRLRLGTDDWLPILRRLNSMTEEEHEQSKKHGHEGWVSVAGVEPDFAYKVSITKVGLAVVHMQAREMAYLFSRHFDLFNLIDSGEAIDAATITPNPYA